MQPGKFFDFGPVFPENRHEEYVTYSSTELQE